MQIPAPATDRFITDIEAAAMLSLSRGYLRQLRVRGGGPKWSNFGKAVRYHVPVLLEWANANTATSTSQYS